MDSKGWIPIELIASFNRVKALTMDVGLVRDVLALSSIAQVRRGGSAAAAAAAASAGATGSGNEEKKDGEEKENAEQHTKEGDAAKVDANWGVGIGMGVVRMHGWERYVLPDAKPSIVMEQEEEEHMRGYEFGAPYGGALYGPPAHPAPLHPGYEFGPGMGYGYGYPPPPGIGQVHGPGQPAFWEEGAGGGQGRGHQHEQQLPDWRLPAPPSGGLMPSAGAGVGSVVNGYGYGHEQSAGPAEGQSPSRPRREGPGANLVNGLHRDASAEKVGVQIDELTTSVAGLRLGDDSHQRSAEHVNVKDKEASLAKKGQREEGEELEDEDEEEDEEDVIFVMGTQNNVSWVS